MAKHIEQWESNPKGMESGYEYESNYSEMMKKVEKEILQVSLGNVPKGKNSKKTSPPIWANRNLQATYFIIESGYYEYKQSCLRDHVLYWSVSSIF